MALLKRDRIPLALGAIAAAALTIAAAVASVANAAPQGGSEIVAQADQTSAGQASEGRTVSSAR